MQNMSIDYLWLLHMYNSMKYARERYAWNSETIGASSENTAGEEKREWYTGGFNCVCNILFLLNNDINTAVVLVPNGFIYKIYRCLLYILECFFMFEKLYNINLM